MHLLYAHVKLQLPQQIMQLVKTHHIDVDSLLDDHVVQQVVQVFLFLFTGTILLWFED
jgi:hypothetical protein